ncbi:MAG: 50S ribosomal protein L24 [Anaerolineales bacterium]|nr:50S ribosomal protein L24 [Anaerolineales bacterium]
MRVKIRKSDTVEIISGRLEEKGKRGEVIKVLPDDHRVVVSGINIRTKHQRQVQTKGRTINPGRIKFEAPLDISNVMLVCPKCNMPVRVSVHRDESGSHRVCKKCQAMID